MPESVPGLTSFLADFHPAAESRAEWEPGVVIHVVSYVTDRQPPLSCVTAVRGVVFRDTEVLVFVNGFGQERITPGGRREPGETEEQTLRREILEETGWTIRSPRRIGFVHLQRRPTVSSDQSNERQPDSLWSIFAADADAHHPDAAIFDAYVRASYLRPIVELELTEPYQQLFLDAATASRHHLSGPPS